MSFLRVLLAASRAFPQLVQDLVHAEAARFLAWREILEGGQELADDGLRRHTDKCMVEPPIVIRVRRDVRPFVRIGPQIEELRKPQWCERLTPNPQCSGGALFGEDKLPVVVPQANQIGIIVEVVELLARTDLRL